MKVLGFILLTIFIFALVSAFYGWIIILLVGVFASIGWISSTIAFIPTAWAIGALFAVLTGALKG